MKGDKRSKVERCGVKFTNDKTTEYEALFSAVTHYEELVVGAKHTLNPPP